MLLSDTWRWMRQSVTNEGFLHVQGEQSTPFQLSARAVWFIRAVVVKLSSMHTLETLVLRQRVFVGYNRSG